MPKGSEGIDGFLSLVERNRMHFSKMIASLIPVLNMLTSGDLGDLLSPDEEDSNDHQPIFDTFIVPTLRVGMPPETLQRLATLERCRMSSHAERGNYRAIEIL